MIGLPQLAMIQRNGITLLALILCGGSLWAAWAQHRHLLELRGQRQTTPARVSSFSDDSPGTAEIAAATRASPETTSPELLRLRAEVTALRRRQRELASVPAEAGRLRAQLAAIATNSAAAAPLPPGYIRKAQARLSGYATPEATIESFLWALQNRDFTNLLHMFTPESAAKLQADVKRSGRSPEEFFKDTEVLPGMAIQSQSTLPDGSVELRVEFAPGMPAQKVRLQPLNGEWRLVAPF